MKIKNVVSIIFTLLISMLSCNQKKVFPKKVFTEEIKIYPLSPFKTFWTDTRPIVVNTLFIIETSNTDYQKIKKTAIQYVDSLKPNLLHGKDTLNRIKFFFAGDDFDHTYKRSHVKPFSDYVKYTKFEFYYLNKKLIKNADCGVTKNGNVFCNENNNSAQQK